MMTALYFRAILARALVLGPGMVSANLKNRWSSTWQKYCERKSSCVQMIFAPARAASSARRSWLARFFSGSAEQAICVRPTWTIREESMRLGREFFLAIIGRQLLPAFVHGSRQQRIA